MSPDPPGMLPDVAAVLGTDGGAVVAEAAGVRTVELGSLRAEDAIGLVCNFTPISGRGAMALRSFALASQFYGPLFRKLTSSTGAELENIVFTKSKASYYFVMTPTRRCLVKCGVLRDASHKPLLARENLDRKALAAFCRRVVAFRFKDGEPTLQQVADGAREKLEFADRGPQLFDFSKLRRASEGLVFLEPPAPVGAEAGADDATLREALPVALAGDALLEPFWPEGLGIVRCFLSALDASSALAEWSAGASQEVVQQNFAAAFAQLKTLGARTRASVLKSDEKQYGLAPSTRYRTLGSTTSAGATL